MYLLIHIYYSLIFMDLFIFYTAPRIGNTIFAAFVNRKIPSSYRVEVDTDIVTIIPKVFRMYRHAGIPVVVDSDEAGDLYMYIYIFRICVYIYLYTYLYVFELSPNIYMYACIIYTT
jgi:hypothetical protein